MVNYSNYNINGCQKKDHISEEIDKISKKIFLEIEITQYLSHNSCSFDEAEWIIDDIAKWLKQKREDLEYDDLDHYFSQTKNRDVGNDMVPQMNHVGRC